MRHQASIQTIRAITPIEGRDRIVSATVLGWNVIVRKDEYVPGDRCIYVEIDSVLPEREEFEFMRKHKFRVRTMKMGGVLSQGICFPLSLLPEDKVYMEGDDVTEQLGITKYDEYGDEPKQEKTGRKYSKVERFIRRHLPGLGHLIYDRKKADTKFPDCISKTDETRCQNLPWDVYTGMGCLYEVREKVDGQSGTFLLRRRKYRLPFADPYEFVVCSRNKRLPVPDGSSWWDVAKKYDVERVLRRIIRENDWIALQGEVIGPGIQGNVYHVTENDVYFFNYVTPYGKLDGQSAEFELEKYGLKWVPLVARNYALPATVEEMLEFATDESRLHPTLREGVVLRNYYEDISFKAVSNDYLLKHGK